MRRARCFSGGREQRVRTTAESPRRGPGVVTVAGRGGAGPLGLGRSFYSPWDFYFPIWRRGLSTATGHRDRALKPRQAAGPGAEVAPPCRTPRQARSVPRLLIGKHRHRVPHGDQGIPEPPSRDPSPMGLTWHSARSPAQTHVRAKPGSEGRKSVSRPRCIEGVHSPRKAQCFPESRAPNGHCQRPEPGTNQLLKGRWGFFGVVSHPHPLPAGFAQ